MDNEQQRKLDDEQDESRAASVALGYSLGREVEEAKAKQVALADVRGYRPTERNTDPENAPPSVTFVDERAKTVWESKQRELNERDAAVRIQFPPGSRLYVQAKLRDRRRAGLAFSAKTRVAVDIVDANDRTVEERLARGEQIVTPLGARAIKYDDALIVFDGPSMAAADTRVTELKAQIDAKDAQLAEQNAELAELRKLRDASKDADAVKPERLAKPKAEAATKPMPDAAPTGKDIAGK